MLLSDFDDDLKKNKLVDLKFLYDDLLLDDIELNKVVLVMECHHHVLHNAVLDDLFSYEDDRQNDLNIKVVFVEKYVLLLLSLLLVMV